MSRAIYLIKKLDTSPCTVCNHYKMPSFPNHQGNKCRAVINRITADSTSRYVTNVYKATTATKPSFSPLSELEQAGPVKSQL